MRSDGTPLVDAARLARATTGLRWVGAVLVLALAPLFPNLGPVFVAAFVVAIAASALVLPRVRSVPAAHAVDTALVVYAMLLFAPDHEWTVAFMGVLVVISGAFRFGRVGAFVTASVLAAAYLGIALFRAQAFGYELEPQRIGFGAAVYLLTALLMSSVLLELQTLRDRTEGQTERYEALLRAQSDLGQVVVLSEAGRVLFVNEAFAQLVGRPLTEIDDIRVLYDLVAKEERDAFRERVETNVRAGRSITLDVPIVRPDNERRYLEVAVKPFGTSAHARLVVLARDITDRTYAEDALAHQALHDILTGLPNRTLLHDRLEQAILDAKRRHETLSLLLIDLDDFKVVNDSFGHQVGDALLMQVGPRFQAELREADTVARLGGDEFAIVLPGTDRSSAGRVAAALLRSLERPFVVEAEALLVGASIGISVYPDHGDSANLLMQRADIAMYAAKTDFGNGYAVYAPEHDQHGANRLALLTDLRNAIERDDLVLEFQPQVSLRTGRVTAVEALVRWRHASRGLIPPASFIPFAEQTGLIKPLTELVLRAALVEAKAWRAAGHDVPVAVNLSTRNLLDPLFPQHVTDVLQELAVPASALRFEITESVLLAEPERSMLTLSELRGLGVQLALDDFGTGYSSLSYLNRLPLHEVKIDRSFIAELCSPDASSSTIVQATVDLGHRLGFAVVAEGVETQAEWDRLVELGCDIVQGYHIARPMPAADVARWLTALAQREPSAAAAAD